MKTARFWTYLNDDWVKLSIRPGQSLSWHRSWRHDEGWSSVSKTWTNHGGSVSQEWETDGLDCDGRLTQGGTMHCPISQLKALDAFSDEETQFPEWAGILTPDWQHGDTAVYDQYAQAANY